MQSTDVSLFSLDGQGFKGLIGAGLGWLEQHYEIVNRLNVFPVPDGDTGTNMLLTLRAAYHAIADESADAVGVIAEKLAHGALYGSRGNSGTVLSQVFRGFARAFANLQSFDAASLARAFGEAARLAYQTFQRPVEGTILTVAREIAEEIEALAGHVRDLRQLWSRAVSRGKQAVARTPDLLPILRKAGVVDSGGQGLVLLLEGMLRHLNGQPTQAAPGENDADSDRLLSDAELREAFALSAEYDEDDGFGYDVQFIIRGEQLNVERIRAVIAQMGSSPIVIGDSAAVKVHVHVADPQVPLAYGRSQGLLDDEVIENMQSQAERYLAMRTGQNRADDTPFSVNPGEVAVVAVVPGTGLRRLFFDQRAAGLVAGGQTMNPSTGELLDAARRTGTDKVILLPNNPNVILAARQAAALAEADAGHVLRIAVVPTRSVPEGLAALLAYEPGDDLDSALSRMIKAAGEVCSGAITRATRDLEIDGMQVHDGQLIGLVADKLAAAEGDHLAVARALLDQMGQMGAADFELATFYFGGSATEADAEALCTALSTQYPHLEFEVREGGQPHYDYLIGLE